MKRKRSFLEWIDTNSEPLLVVMVSIVLGTLCATVMLVAIKYLVS